jgi:hypothetical protein
LIAKRFPDISERNCCHAPPPNSRFEVELDYLSDGRLHVRKRHVKVTTQVVPIILIFVTVQSMETGPEGTRHLADQADYLSTADESAALHYHIISLELAPGDSHRSLR